MSQFGQNYSKDYSNDYYINNRFNNEPSIEEQEDIEAEERRKRHQRYLKRRYGPQALNEPQPFRHGYTRKSFFKPSIQEEIPSVNVPPRLEKRPVAPLPTTQGLRQYYEYLEKNHEPQWNFIPYDELYQAFQQSPTELRQYAGSSNLRRYNASDLVFCGPAGGSMFNTYPINTVRRYIAAKSYARDANAQGIRICADKVAREMGWL